MAASDEKGEEKKVPPLVGFKCVKPQLIFPSGKAGDAVGFYVEVFGAKVVRASTIELAPKTKESTIPTRQMYRAELKIGPTVLVVRDAGYVDLVMEKEQITGVSLRVETNDLEGALVKAVESGCVLEVPIEDDKLGLVPSGTRTCKVRDPYGVLWTIAQDKGEEADAGDAMHVDP